MNREGSPQIEATLWKQMKATCQVREQQWIISQRMHWYRNVNQMKVGAAVRAGVGTTMTDAVHLIYWPDCHWWNLRSAFIECSGRLSWIISTCSDWKLNLEQEYYPGSNRATPRMNPFFFSSVYIWISFKAVRGFLSNTSRCRKHLHHWGIGVRG